MVKNTAFLLHSKIKHQFNQINCNIVVIKSLRKFTSEFIFGGKGFALKKPVKKFQAKADCFLCIYLQNYRTKKKPPGSGPFKDIETHFEGGLFPLPGPDFIP